MRVAATVQQRRWIFLFARVCSQLVCISASTQYLVHYLPSERGNHVLPSASAQRQPSPPWRLRCGMARCRRTTRRPTRRARSGNTKSTAHHCRRRASSKEGAGIRRSDARRDNHGKVGHPSRHRQQRDRRAVSRVMRRLAGGVSIITAGRDEDITGMTVTSLTSLSASPPRLLVSVNRQASSFAPIERHRVFGVNILGSEQQELASRFSNGRLKGAQRLKAYPGGPGRRACLCSAILSRRSSARSRRSSSDIRTGSSSAAC